MALRFQAELHYSAGSGMAQWVADQMSVRLGMAFHLREDSRDQELTRVITEIISSGSQDNRRDSIYINVFWPDDQEALAIDTRDTLMAINPWLIPDDKGRKSFMEYHYCNHDQEPPAPCQPYWQWRLEDE